MARITITTDQGVLVSSWIDTDDDDRQYMGLLARAEAQIDDQLSTDMAHDVKYARRQDGRDELTGEAK